MSGEYPRPAGEDSLQGGGVRGKTKPEKLRVVIPL
jgi:hypothetical protein